jgi:hypothetical protein
MPLCQIKRPGARVQLVEKVVIATRMLTNHHGRVLVLIPKTQTHILSPETGPKVSMTEKAAHLYDVKMTATALLAIKSTMYLMKRGGNRTHIARSHATMHVPATMTGTDITNMQVKAALTGPPQGLQDLPPRTNPWTVRAQATGSPMILTLVVLIPVIVMPHPLEMTALAALYEGMIILLMIRLTKVLGIMVIHLVVILGQQNVLGIQKPSTGAPIQSCYEILTPRIRVQVDHRL